VFSVGEVGECESEGDGDVVNVEDLGAHADLVTLCVFEDTALDKVGSTDTEDDNGPKVKTGTVGCVVLLGHIAMPSIIQATVEVGHISEASTEGKEYTEVLSVCVVVMTTVLVFSASVALRLVVSYVEAAALASSAKRLKIMQ
jgi:hypothetical protein